jgi:hypothetical protein
LNGSDLLLVGAGGFGRETAEAVHAVNDATPGRWNLLGYVDDDPARTRATVSGLSVVGTITEVSGFPDARLALCTGHPGNFGSHIGAHVGIMPLVVLTHDVRVDDFAILGAGVRLAGGVRVGEGAYVGSGALIREGRTVGPGALVGMGAVVTRDVPAGEVWAGVPARRKHASNG